MNTIAESFGSAIGNYFNDIFMNKKPEKGAFRNTLAQGFASAGSGLISNTIQKQVFGNQGFVANIARNFLSEEMIGAIFPKTQLELAKERRDLLEQIRDGVYAIAQSPTGTVYPGAGTYARQQALAGVGQFPYGGGTRGGSSMNDFLRDHLKNRRGSFTVMDLIGEEMFKGGSDSMFRRQNLLNTKGYTPYTGNGSTASSMTSLLIKALFGGFFADGGYLGAGKFGIAGEAGPELIQGPAKITPLGVGGNVTVNVAVDANGQSSVADSSGDGARELGHMVSQAVQSELIEQQRPGGLLSAF